MRVVLLALVAFVCARELTLYAVPNPPFIIEETDGSLIGYEVDMVTSLLEQLKLADPSLTWVWNTTTTELVFQQVHDHGDDALGLGGLTVLSSRTELVEFSYAFHYGGLDILTLEKPTASNLMQWFEPFSLGVWLFMVLSTWFSGFVIWLLERDYQPDAFPRTPWLGINEGIWFCWGTLTGNVQKNLMGFPARMYFVGFSVLSLVIVAAYTANFATLLTVERLALNVPHAEKLSESTVACVLGSSGARFMANMYPGSPVQLVPNFEAAVNELYIGAADAVVGDAATMIYFMAERNYAENLKLSGTILTGDRYSVVMSKNSPLRLGVDRGLLWLEENGVESFLFNKWFNRYIPKRSAFPESRMDLLELSGLLVLLLVSFVIAIVTCIWFTVYRFL